jgi:hypothetical protein
MVSAPPAPPGNLIKKGCALPNLTPVSLSGAQGGFVALYPANKSKQLSCWLFDRAQSSKPARSMRTL